MSDWNGKGLPPVGVWCWIEGGCGEHPLQHFGRIEYISDSYVLYVREERGEYCQRMKGITFRADETPEQKAARVRKETAMQMFVDSGYSLTFWADDPDDAYDIKIEEAIGSMYALYDLGYRKPE